MKSQIDIAREALPRIKEALHECCDQIDPGTHGNTWDKGADAMCELERLIAALQPVADEREAFEKAWPEIHKHGIERGWRGIAEAAWKAARAFLPPQAVEPILDHITFDERSAIASTLTDDLYDSKDWRDGGIVERIEWLRGMYEDKKVEIAELFAMLEAAEEDRKLLDSGCIMTYECDEFGMEYMCERRVLDLRAAIRAAMEKEQQS